MSGSMKETITKGVRGHQMIALAPRSITDDTSDMEWLCSCGETGAGPTPVKSQQDFWAHVKSQDVAPAPLWVKIVGTAILIPPVVLIVGGVTYAAVWIWTQVGEML